MRSAAANGSAVVGRRARRALGGGAGEGDGGGEVVLVVLMFPDVGYRRLGSGRPIDRPGVRGQRKLARPGNGDGAGGNLLAGAEMKGVNAQSATPDQLALLCKNRTAETASIEREWR